jgi:hypothetical protein
MRVGLATGGKLDAAAGSDDATTGAGDDGGAAGLEASELLAGDSDSTALPPP